MVQRLKLQYDEPLSNLAFKLNLRRYTLADFVELPVGLPVPACLLIEYLFLF